MSARASNAALNLAEYRARASVLASRPRFLVVELTQGCNLRCPMCRPAAIPFRSRIMSDALFDRVAEELFPTAELIDLRGWGESLVLPNIMERAALAARSGAELRFVTNLSFRRDSALELLALHHAHVGISVDTADPQLFGRLRANGRLDLVARNLAALSELYRSNWGAAERLILLCTVQRPALATLSDLADFAARVGVRRIQLAAVSAPEESDLSLAGFDKAVDEALDRLAHRARSLGIAIRCTTRIGSQPVNAPGVPACLHVWSYAHIAYDGRVGYCDHLIGPELDDHCMGSLADSSFEAIWNGALWRALRRDHSGGSADFPAHREACAWCYVNRRVEFEDRFDPSLARWRHDLSDSPA